MYRPHSKAVWRETEFLTMERFPTFCTLLPTAEELDHMFWKCGAAVLSYIIQPGQGCGANAFLYLCHKDSYDERSLSVSARWAIRRSRRELKFNLLDWGLLQQQGEACFRETRNRVGLSDGKARKYESMIRRISFHRGNCAVGAWKDDMLIGFVTLSIVDRAIEITGSYSLSDFLRYHPQDGLINFVMGSLMKDNDLEVASMGLSSMQSARPTSDGLHTFKTKVGFKPIPIQRVIALHPLLRPFARKAILIGMEGMLWLMPHSRIIRKCRGGLSTLLSTTELEY